MFRKMCLGQKSKVLLRRTLTVLTNTPVIAAIVRHPALRTRKEYVMCAALCVRKVGAIDPQLPLD
jgi:hypothetical protein